MKLKHCTVLSRPCPDGERIVHVVPGWGRSSNSA